MASSYDFQELVRKMRETGGQIGQVVGLFVGGALGFLGGIGGPVIVRFNYETHVLTGPIANIIGGVIGMLGGAIFGRLIFGLIGTGCGYLSGYIIWSIFLGGRYLYQYLIPIRYHN